MAEYLDKTGLTYLWSKIKAKFDAKADKTALDAKADKTALDAKADKTALDAKADKTTADALGKRIDNLILSSGTESSAEVVDARTGYDGTAYETLGTSIRTQVSELKEDIDNLYDDLDTSYTETAYRNWNDLTSTISAYVYWGMNKIYKAGYVKSIIVKCGSNYADAEIAITKAGDHLGGHNKNIQFTAVKGINVVEVDDYIDFDFYIFIKAPTCYDAIENSDYKSCIYDIELNFTNYNQFAIGVERKSIIERINDITYTPFIEYNAKLEWITDISIYNTSYNYYKLEYIWHNVNGYDVYFRLSGSRDSQTWEMVSNIERNTRPNPCKDCEYFENNDFSIAVDWRNAPQSVNLYNYLIKDKCVFHKTEIDVNGAYLLKDNTSKIIVVDCFGKGDFTSIKSACESITDSSQYNQYEVVVRPGTYNENYIIVPNYVHIHGIKPNTVVVTSEGITGTTLAVFDQRNGNSKLSNMHIKSQTGYCIHYDVGLNKCVIKNENLILEKLPNSTDGAIVAIGGGSFRYGTVFEWENCTFLNCTADCHTNQSTYENTRVIFNNCRFVNSYLRCGSVGGYGNCIYEINNCDFGNRYSLVGWNQGILNVDDPSLYLANTTEWQIVGHGNRNFTPLLKSDGEGLVFECNTNNISVSGSAMDILFGAVKIHNGNAYGLYRVQDKQAGLPPYTENTDVYQMWKRLGDCSVNNKTLTVTVDGVSKTYIFDKNYLALKTSEADIIEDINSVVTNALLKKYVPDCWSNINTSEKDYVTAKTNGIEKYQFVYRNGNVCVENEKDVFGIAIEEGYENELVQVWTGECIPLDLPDGSYGIGADGKLDINATNKIGVVSQGIFMRN